MEAVDVLLRVDGSQDLGLVHVLGERQLDEDSVDRVVRIQIRDEIEDVALGRVCGKPVVARIDASFVRCLVLRADVDVRRGVVADEDRRQAHGASERAHVLRDLGANLEGERLSVDAYGGHRAVA